MLKKHGATVVEVNFNKETLEALPTLESLIPMSE